MDKIVKSSDDKCFFFFFFWHATICDIINKMNYKHYSDVLLYIGHVEESYLFQHRNFVSVYLQ